MKQQINFQRNVFKAKYSNNSVMHLILVCAVTYIILQALYIILMVVSDTPQLVMDNWMMPNIALPTFDQWIYKPWTLFSFFWMHISFLNLLSNMLWLYLFGSVIQTFLGYREIFPMFIITSLVSGIGFLLVSMFWKTMPATLQVSSISGLMAFAIGAITIVPRHRFFVTERFSIPISVVLAIFLVLNVLTLNFKNPQIIVMAFAALSGYLYIRLLKSGYRPGSVIYKIWDKFQSIFTPSENMSDRGDNFKRTKTLKISSHQIVEKPSEEYIDLLLDKINKKGFDSLTAEEKATLKNAGRN